MTEQNEKIIKELEKGCGKRSCGKIINVRDRTPIGAGSSRFIMTGVHQETKLCKICQAKLQAYKEWEQREKEILDKANNFYNEFDLASNCTEDDQLFKRLWNEYLGERNEDTKR